MLSATISRSASPDYGAAADDVEQLVPINGAEERFGPLLSGGGWHERLGEANEDIPARSALVDMILDEQPLFGPDGVLHESGEQVVRWAHAEQRQRRSSAGHVFMEDTTLHPRTRSMVR